MDIFEISERIQPGNSVTDFRKRSMGTLHCVIKQILLSVDGNLVTQADRWFPLDQGSGCGTGGTTFRTPIQPNFEKRTLYYMVLKHLEHFGYAYQMRNSQVLRKLTVPMFIFTYTCKSAFSMIAVMKTKYRTFITDEHLGHCMRIVLTPKKPNFKKVASELQGHVSH